MPRKLIYLFFLLAPTALFGQQTHPILPIGSSAPNFELPGVDGEIHKLSDYADKPVLAVVFTCNHCPIAQMYERRIEQLYEDYGKRGVAVVAIQGNDPKAIRIDELDSSDVSDTLDDMRIRVQYKHLQYPYLYGGDTQEVTRAYGPQATPHIFIFDKERRLRYEGRIDNSYRTEQVKTNDAREAIEAVLAGREVAVKHTGVFGCSTKWSEKSAQREEAERKIEAQPVHVEKVDAAGLKTLRANPLHHVTLISFWATWCGSCVAEFADLQDTYRMYNSRDFDLVTVSANMPDEEPSVLRLLQKKRATSRNLLFASDDTEKLQAAFDTEWQSAVPYTVVLDPDGKVIYKTLGTVDLWRYVERFSLPCPPITSASTATGRLTESWKTVLTRAGCFLGSGVSRRRVVGVRRPVEYAGWTEVGRATQEPPDRAICMNGKRTPFMNSDWGTDNTNPAKEIVAK